MPLDASICRGKKIILANSIRKVYQAPSTTEYCSQRQRLRKRETLPAFQSLLQVSTRISFEGT